MFGETWPELETIAAIEMVLEKMLWDSHHIKVYKAKKQEQEEHWPSDDPTATQL